MSMMIQNIAGGYDDTLVVRDLSAQINYGEIVGVFGRNGVGKTTLARILSGELKISHGTISLDGRDITAFGSHLCRKNGIGYMPQTSMVFDQLTVAENLALVRDPFDIAPYFQRFPRLEERLKQKAGTMSGGERKILSFVRTMIEPTNILILDEPSEGIQHENITLMRECLVEKREAGIGILLIEQNLNMLDGLVDHYWGIETGRLAHHASAAETTSQQIIELLSV